MRPAFPKWVRRIDPLLEAEDTNHIYRAFREYRFAKAKSKPLGEMLFTVSSLNPGWLGGLLLVLLVTTLLSSFGCIGVVLVFLGLGYARLSSRANPRTIEKFPASVGEVFGTRGIHILAFKDLYMTGCGGGTILEAMYLERREGQHLVAPVVTGVVAALICFPLTVWMFPGSLILLAGIAWLAWNFARWTITKSCWHALDHDLEPLVRIWMRGTTKTIAWDYARGDARRGCFLFFGLILVFLLPAVVFSLMGDFFRDIDMDLLRLGVDGGMIALPVTASLAVMAIGLWLCVKTGENTSMQRERLSEMKGRADRAFEDLIEHIEVHPDRADQKSNS